MWTSFIALLLKGSTDKAAIAEGSAFDTYLEKALAPRNCDQAYGGR